MVRTNHCVWFQAKAFIDRSLKEHALASAERNTLFFRNLTALNDGTITCMNENMHREIERHLANERVMKMRDMQALLKYVDGLGLGDSVNELKNQVIVVAAQSGNQDNARTLYLRLH